MPAPPETRHGVDPEFLDADRFVQRANELNGKCSREWVRAAMMDAAARCHALVWITREGSPDQALEQAAAYDASEYAKMLRDNLDGIEAVDRASSAGATAQN